MELFNTFNEKLFEEMTERVFLSKRELTQKEKADLLLQVKRLNIPYTLKDSFNLIFFGLVIGTFTPFFVEMYVLNMTINIILKIILVLLALYFVTFAIQQVFQRMKYAKRYEKRFELLIEHLSK